MYNRTIKPEPNTLKRNKYIKSYDYDRKHFSKRSVQEYPVDKFNLEI